MLYKFIASPFLFWILLAPLNLPAANDSTVIGFHYYMHPFPLDADYRSYNTINGIELVIDTVCVGDTVHVTTVWDPVGLMQAADSTVMQFSYIVQCGSHVDSFFTGAFDYVVPDTGIVVIGANNGCVFFFSPAIIVSGYTGLLVNFYTCSYSLGIGLISNDCKPVADFSLDKREICSPACIAVTDLSKHFPQQWLWHFEGGVPEYFTGTAPPGVCYETAGNYDVALIVQNAFGADTLTLTNYVYVYQGNTVHDVQHNFTVQEGTSVTLHACAHGYRYEWTEKGQPLVHLDSVVTVYPDETETILLRVISDSVCITTCEYEINVITGLLVPTGFSPNGDGVNDIFRMLNTNIALDRFGIYNRWGEKLYEAANIEDGWDGYYQNVAQPLGTYVWQAEYFTNAGKRKAAKGNVTLVR